MSEARTKTYYLVRVVFVLLTPLFGRQVYRHDLPLNELKPDALLPMIASLKEKGCEVEIVKVTEEPVTLVAGHA